MFDKTDLQKKMDEAERPDLAMAMELAGMFHEELDRVSQSISNQIGQAVNLNAQTARRVTELEEQLKRFIQESEKTRYNRAEKELKEAEARYLIAREHKEGLSTDEKIQAVKIVEDRLAIAERERREKQKARLDDLVQSAIKTAVNAVIGVMTLALFTGLILLVGRALGLVVQLP